MNLAAQLGYLEIAKLLVTKGHANVNSQANYDGNTPLHISARFGTSEVFEFLLNSGADTTILNNDGESVRDIAEYSNSSKCLELLDK